MIIDLKNGKNGTAPVVRLNSGHMLLWWDLEPMLCTEMPASMRCIKQFKVDIVS